MKLTAREIFIGEYLDRKMKNHNLPMSMKYYALLSKNIDLAEKAWNRKLKKEQL